MDRGRKILFRRYWGPGGWKPTPITEEEFQTAKQEGYLFDFPDVKTHRETLDELKSILLQIDYADIENAFLYSLSARSLEYRSALGSFWYASAIPEHDTDCGLGVTGDTHCYLCGWNLRRPKLDIGNWNELNFERYKWGGIRHTQLEYALFDLRQFLKLPKVTYTQEDVRILRNVLGCVSKLDGTDKAGKLRDVLVREKVLKSNRDEIEVLLNILGICGILSSDAAPCYRDKFADEYDRAPVEHTNDFAYPVNRWRAADGVNWGMFYKVFPSLRNENAFNSMINGSNTV